MKTRKADWKAYFQLIRRANIPLLVLLGYFLVQLVYSRISTDLVPFASKIQTQETVYHRLLQIPSGWDKILYCIFNENDIE